MTRSVTTLDLGDLSQLTVSVSVVPYLTALAFATEGSGGLARGLPPVIRAEVDRALGERERDALSVFSRSRRQTVPSSVLQVTPRTTNPLAESLDAISSLSADTIVADIGEAFGADVPRVWQEVVRRPRHWAGAFAAAVGAAADATSGLMARAEPLIAREVERIGVAVVQNQVPTLLSTLTPRVTFTGSTLSLAPPPDNDDPGETHRLGSRRLVLVPMLAGSNMLGHFLDHPGGAWIAYPVPGIATLLGGQRRREPADRLEALVGTRRSAVLRALERSSTMHELASAVGCAPSSLTFHCERLESAGLVVR